jgi:DNA-3-methyladenine glycosylase II
VLVIDVQSGLVSSLLMDNLKQQKNILLKQDPTLRRLFARHRDLHFSPQNKRSPFESLVRAVANQQLHGKAAQTILGRLIDLFPKKNFPDPEDLLKLSDLKLRKCGFSNSKVRSIKDIAAKTLDGVVPDKRQIKKMKNIEIIEKITQIHGVGRWTVEMLLIFQLGRMDVWPVDDFGVRKGYQIWKKKKEFPTAKELKDLGAQWEPFQTVVALHLWREADLQKTLKKAKK